MNYSIENYDRPSVAADIVVFGFESTKSDSNKKLGNKQLKVLLIQRNEEPYRMQFALPGGFLRKEETIEETAARELLEETGLFDAKMINLKLYSEKGRDPRGWIVSEGFIALTRAVKPVTDADSDALSATWFDFDYYVDDTSGSKTPVEYITLRSGNMSIKLAYEKGVNIGLRALAFDHDRILYDAFKKLQDEVVNHDMIFDLLPKLFTISDIQQPYEIITGETNTRQNFRQKIMSKIEATDQYETGTGHRPSQLYKKKGTD